MAGKFEFLDGLCVIPNCAERFAQVAAQQAALRFQGRRDFDVLPAGLRISLADAAQSAPEPRIGQRTVEQDRLVKRYTRRLNSIFCREQESAQGDGLRVSR